MAQTRTPQQTQKAHIKSRTILVFTIFTAAYLLLAGRLTYLQAFRRSFFISKAMKYRVNRNKLPARRGLIYDRNGDPLAVNVPAVEIYADPTMVKDPVKTADLVANLINRDRNVIERQLNPGKKTHYVSLIRHAPVSLGDTIKQLKIEGVFVQSDTNRSYPNERLAAQVLGFTNKDLKGVEGIEFSQDGLLQGKDGLIYGEVDRQGCFLPGTTHTQDPVNGHDITLTIDKTLQNVAENELNAALKAHHAKKAVVVVLDPRNGEIIALANAPSYNPNQPAPIGGIPKAKVAQYTAIWRDYAVSDLYEPGSTMKTITSSAVLQVEGIEAMHRHIYCNGIMQIGKHPIHCAVDPPYYGVHKDEDLRGVLKESCNIGMAHFGLHLGQNNVYDFIQKYGFLEKPNSGLPGEERSHLLAPSDFNRFTQSTGWSQIQLANISFGQGISVTPLQMAAAYGAIANGGTLYRPHIIKSISNGDAQEYTKPAAIRKVLDPQVAEAVRSMLGTVVQEGTGKPAQIAGFSVGGKTGSAQVAGRHGYENGHYVASFIGLVPLSQPRLVILCAVYEPEGVHWGAAVAAPVVHNIAKRAVLQMHLTPDAPQLTDWDDRHSKKKQYAVTTSLAELLDKN